MSSLIPAVHLAPNEPPDAPAIRLADPVAFTLPLHMLRGLLLIMGDGSAHAPAALCAEPTADQRFVKLVVSNGKACLLVRRPLLQPLQPLLIPRVLCADARGLARRAVSKLNVHVSAAPERWVTFAGKYRHACALTCTDAQPVNYQRFVPLKPSLLCGDYDPRQYLRLWRALHKVLNVPDDAELPVRLRQNGGNAARVSIPGGNVIATLVSVRQRDSHPEWDELALQNFELLPRVTTRAVSA